jgi:hypothetical protein
LTYYRYAGGADKAEIGLDSGFVLFEGIFLHLFYRWFLPIQTPAFSHKSFQELFLLFILSA